MSDIPTEIPPTPSEQTTLVPTAGEVSPLSSPSPTKPHRKRFLLIGGLVLGLFSVLCLVICVLTLGTGLLKSATERPKVQQVIDAYMKAMAAQDAARAYALFSTRAQRSTSQADVEKGLAGNNYLVFDGYQGVTITSFNVSVGVNTNPNLPQGTIAKVAGTVSYVNGITGSFTAVLEQEGTEWLLDGINVTVPPDKIRP